MEIKELLGKLTDYFLNQDKKTVAYTAASLLIDICRYHYSSELPDEEWECLLERSQKNYQFVDQFITENAPEKLRVFHMDIDGTSISEMEFN